MQNTAHILPVAPAPPQEKSASAPKGPRPEEHSADSLRNMAVLFTDVVGSTVYFKTHGDVAGRKMLKQHEELAAPPILEHGGVVVKMLGDSVMSYFFCAREALKAAIKIQQRFQQRNNQRNDPQHHIRVRIGVHFGEGLLEERDIFGDVVNMVAKFLPLVHGDEIGVSRAVFDQVKGFPQIRFEGVSLPEKEFFPKGFELYRVIWEGNVDLSPMTKTLLHVRPLFRLGKTGFTKAWEKFLMEKTTRWSHAIEREDVREDKSLAIIVKDPPTCISMAKRVLESLRVNLGTDGAQVLPLQALIDVGPFLRGNKIALEDLKVDWEEVEPGKIYISSQAFHLLKGRCELGLISPAPGKHPQPFYCLGRSEGAGNQASGFLYRSALGNGDLSPCFYCGSKRHAASRCPSKGITELKPALSRIGYLSLEQINRLFFAYLNAGASEMEARMGEGADPNDTSLWACRSFYDLKYFYQLRFFRTLWNNREEDWNRVKDNREERNYGGLAWIALDCIRVSNLDHAESVLRDSLYQEPEDYKPYCALGILSVERNDFSQAKAYIRKALEKAQTTPQKSFVLFLLSRIYSLQGDPARALEMIRKVLHHNPYFAEALYEEILLNVKKGKEGMALHQLIRLIQSNREYYVHALIDPELCRLGAMIQPKLKSLVDASRDEANRVLCAGREDLTDLKKWMGEDETEVQEAESLHARVEELSKMEGYFAYLDIVHYGNQLIGTCRIALQERRKTAGRAVREISERYERCSRYAKTFPYPFLIRPFRYALQTIHGKLSRDWEMDGQGTPTKYKEILEAARRISADLDPLESRMQRLELARRFLSFMGRFLKKTLIFQSANLLLAIILFPIAMYYLGFLVPGLSIPPHHIWHYQKVVLSLGAVSGILLAGAMSGKTSVQRRRSRR